MENHGNPYPLFVPPGAAQEAKIIRVIDGRYSLQFTVADSGFTKADGKLYQLQYQDETHFKAVNAETGRGTFFHYLPVRGNRVFVAYIGQIREKRTKRIAWH